MARRFTFLVLFAFFAVLSSQAEVDFSIRYQSRKIYYTNDEIVLKLTISNSVDSEMSELSFYLADDPRESFGFDLRSLSGEPVPLSRDFVASLNNRGAYRVVHLIPGQELSINVPLNDWVDLSLPGQYRLTGMFYPMLRGMEIEAVQADAVLNLSLMPKHNQQWKDKLDEGVRDALIARDMNPLSVIKETLLSRSKSQYNRAILYLDLESLAAASSRKLEDKELENNLLSGIWDDIPGFEHPSASFKLLSSQVYQHEATVRMEVKYEPFGEEFKKDLRFFLHNPDGYWAIRRIEAIYDADVDPARYGQLNLSPSEIVSELLQAVRRRDWEIALRYLDLTDHVKNLPENVDRWNNMSSTEHRQTLSEYHQRLISGRLEDGQIPLTDIETWRISKVYYTDMHGTVTVENARIHSETASGPLRQESTYTFRLEKAPLDRWRVVRYDAVIVR